jgi:hypothetical protein
MASQARVEKALSPYEQLIEFVGAPNSALLASVLQPH